VKRVHLAAALIIGVALLESALGLYQPRAIATDADWKAATDYVRAQMAEHDLVVFAPAWIDPVGRTHLGDKMPIEMVARADEEGFEGIWELSVHGAHAPETKGLSCKEVQRFGRITLRACAHKRTSVSRDFTATFANARVTIQAMSPNDAPERPCTSEGTARLCGASRVERRVMEIDYHPRLGVLVPQINGERITVAYDDVPAGTLVGYVGLHDYYARKNGDGLVTLRVRADDAQSTVVPIRNPTHDGEGWQRFELPLGPGTHTLRFEVEGERATKRLVGFHAEVRGPQ
jgi:hypothetical protein